MLRDVDVARRIYRHPFRTIELGVGCGTAVATKPALRTRPAGEPADRSGRCDRADHVVGRIRDIDRAVGCDGRSGRRPPHGRSGRRALVARVTTTRSGKDGLAAALEVNGADHSVVKVRDQQRVAGDRQAIRRLSDIGRLTLASRAGDGADGTVGGARRQQSGCRHASGDAKTNE